MAGTNERIDSNKAEFLLFMLTSITAGPAEAYGTLCLAIYKLNQRHNDPEASIDQLCAEVEQSLRSVRIAYDA